LLSCELGAPCILSPRELRLKGEQKAGREAETPREEAKEEEMKTIVAAALSLMVAVSLTPAPSLAQSMSAGGSHTVLALLDDQDVQGARENQDLQSPRENQDLQSPRENQDLQSPRANQDLQSPRENQDLQSPRANQDLQSPRVETMSPASAVSR
jgi:hypothetical protein